MARLATSPFSTQRTAQKFKKQKTKKKQKQKQNKTKKRKYLTYKVHHSKVTGTCYVTDSFHIQNINTFKTFPYDGLSYN